MHSRVDADMSCRITLSGLSQMGARRLFSIHLIFKFPMACVLITGFFLVNMDHRTTRNVATKHDTTCNVTPTRTQRTTTQRSKNHRSLTHRTTRIGCAPPETPSQSKKHGGGFCAQRTEIITQLMSQFPPLGPNLPSLDPHWPRSNTDLMILIPATCVRLKHTLRLMAIHCKESPIPKPILFEMVND